MSMHNAPVQQPPPLLKNIRQLEMAHNETIPKLLDSPTFRHAMLNLGISKNDLEKQTVGDFDDGVSEEDVVQIRYKFY